MVSLAKIHAEGRKKVLLGFKEQKTQWEGASCLQLLDLGRARFKTAAHTAPQGSIRGLAKAGNGEI